MSQSAIMHCSGLTVSGVSSPTHGWWAVWADGGLDERLWEESGTPPSVVPQTQILVGFQLCEFQSCPACLQSLFFQSVWIGWQYFVLTMSPFLFPLCFAQVSDWWEEYIYLRGRGPIMVNSNYYAMVRCCCLTIFWKQWQSCTGLV